jgi:cytochrome b involved in lipid metabolism
MFPSTPTSMAMTTTTMQQQRNSSVAAQAAIMSVRRCADGDAAAAADATDDEMSLVRTESFASLDEDDDEDENDDGLQAAIARINAAKLQQGQQQQQEEQGTLLAYCDACPHCNDVCQSPTCPQCDAKRRRRGTTPFDACRRSREPPQEDFRGPSSASREYRCCPIPTYSSSTPIEKRFYTQCQVRRHNHAESAWLVAGDKIYNATPYLSCHPAGESAILRKSGGVVDVTRDVEFHSNKGKKLFRSLEIGRLVPCPGGGGNGSPGGRNKKSSSSAATTNNIKPAVQEGTWWEFWNRL